MKSDYCSISLDGKIVGTNPNYFLLRHCCRGYVTVVCVDVDDLTAGKIRSLRVGDRVLVIGSFNPESNLVNAYFVKNIGKQKNVHNDN